MSEQFHATVIEAAGGVVERDTDDGLVIAVIYRERYGPEWALPKGKRQRDESWQVAALREVTEEIGVTPSIFGVAGATAYMTAGVPKLVLYWRMRAQGEIRPFAANEEVRKLTWVSPAMAIKCLSHTEEANLIRAVFRLDPAQ